MRRIIPFALVLNAIAVTRWAVLFGLGAGVVFVGSDDEHGAVRVVQHVVANGAEDRAAQLAHPARAHHDAHRALLLRHGTQTLTRPLVVHVERVRHLDNKTTGHN